MARSCKSRRSTRVRYRLHLHKAIVFPLLRTRLPRTWRGCHSEFLRTLLSLLSHRSRISTPLYLPSAFPPPFSFFLDFKPPRSMQAPTPCRSLPCLHSCILLHGAGLTHYVFCKARLLVSSKAIPCRIFRGFLKYFTRYITKYANSFSMYISENTLKISSKYHAINIILYKK